MTAKSAKQVPLGKRDLQRAHGRSRLPDGTFK